MSKKTEEEFPPIELIYSVSKEESWEWICAQLDQGAENPVTPIISDHDRSTLSDSPDNSLPTA